MAWSYRKRVKILPGVTINISKGGVSTSIGPKGAKVNIGPRGTYLNTSIPGTGIYSRQKISGGRKSSSVSSNFVESNSNTNRRNSDSSNTKFGCMSWGLFVFLFIMVWGMIGFYLTNHSAPMLFAIALGIFSLLWFAVRKYITRVNGYGFTVGVFIVGSIFSLIMGFAFANESSSSSELTDSQAFITGGGLMISILAWIAINKWSNKKAQEYTEEVEEPEEEHNEESKKENTPEPVKETKEESKTTPQRFSITHEDINIVKEPIIKEQEKIDLSTPINPREPFTRYKFPSVDLLKEHDSEFSPIIDADEIEKNKERIIEIFGSFDIKVDEVKATEGPIVSCYEVKLRYADQISTVRKMSYDLSISISENGARVTVPNEKTVQVEIPNIVKRDVCFKSIICSKDFQESEMELPLPLGRTTAGDTLITDLADMSHLLVCGEGEKGQTDFLNTIIASLLFKKHPNELKLVLIDSKKVEFAPYSPISDHFMAATDENVDAPIITDVTRVVRTLNSLRVFMDHRYDLLKMAGAKNINEYNEKFVNHKLNLTLGHEYMPHVVVIINEYSNLALVAGNDIEPLITRFVQEGHNVGIHIIIATHRTSASTLTRNIKQAFTNRVVFRIGNYNDSRSLGCEDAKLLMENGDFLFCGVGRKPERGQSASIETKETERICEFISCQPGPIEPYELAEPIDAKNITISNPLTDLDPYFEEAAHAIVISQLGSTSMVQRRFSIGYNRTGRLMDQLEQAGIVGPAMGSKPRDVLVPDEKTLNELLLRIKLEEKRTATVQASNEPPKKYSNGFMTEAQYNLIKDECSNLCDFFSLITRKRNVRKEIDESMQLVNNDDSPWSVNDKLQISIFIDVYRCFEGLGHHLDIDDEENVGLCLFMNRYLSPNTDISYTQYPSVKEKLRKSAKGVFETPKLISAQMSLGSNKFLFQKILGNYDKLLQTQYMTRLYRFASAIANADGYIDERERAWIADIMKARDSMIGSKEERKVPTGKTASRQSSDGSARNSLEKLIGLKSAKEEIKKLTNFIKIQQLREKEGLKSSSVSYHCVFTGNPGTGKTTVARAVADIYKELGVLEKGHLVETDRSGLVAEYVGQTAVKTNKIIDSALDGVLFIDEAYSLVQGGASDYGKEAISTLLKRMEDDRDRLVVILAGYGDEMKDFINSNPGLQSRFNRYINFEDYSADELLQIFKFNVKNADYKLTPDAEEKIKAKLEDAVAHKDRNFGNARFVRNLFEKTLENQATRLVSEDDLDASKLTMIEAEDLYSC